MRQKRLLTGTLPCRLCSVITALRYWDINQKIIDRVGYSIVPGGNPILGGGTLGIAKKLQVSRGCFGILSNGSPQIR